MEQDIEKEVESTKHGRVSKRFWIVIITFIIVALSCLSLVRYYYPIYVRPVAPQLALETDAGNNTHGEVIQEKYTEAGVPQEIVDKLNQSQPSKESSGLEEFECGQSQFTKGNFEGAIKEYENSLRVAPNGFFAGSCWGQISASYFRLGNIDKAIDAANEELKLSSEGTDGLGQLGFLYSKKGEYEKAIPYFIDLIAKKGENCLYCYELAVAYENTGETEKAIEYYGRSLSSYKEKGMPPRREIEKNVEKLKSSLK
jgi:tetratricopeptide (TPR) repeat protein